MFPDAITKGIPDLVESTNTLSGAIYTSTKNLKSPITDLVTTFNTSSKETKKLTNKLVFWTKVMAFAIIMQALAIIGQIIAILSTRT